MGDFIEFSQIDDSSQRLTVRATALHHFNCFAEYMLHCQRKNSAMLLTKRLPPPDHMDAYYPREKQRSMAFAVLNCG